MIFIPLLSVLGSLTTVLVAWFSEGVSEIWYRGKAICATGDRRFDTGEILTTTAWARFQHDRGVCSTDVFLQPIGDAVHWSQFQSLPLGPEAMPWWDSARDLCDGSGYISQSIHGWPMRAMLSRERAQSASGTAVPWWCDEQAAGRWRSLEAGLPIVGISFGLFEQASSGNSTYLSLGTFAMAEGVFGRLPLLPVVPGFLVDSLAYGGAWGVLLLTPGFARRSRRWWRVRRSRCPWCGHERRGGGGAECQECGRRPELVKSMATRRVFVLAIACALLLVAIEAAAIIGLHAHLRSFDDPDERLVESGTVDRVLARLDALRAVPSAEQWHLIADENRLLCLAARYDRVELVRALIDRNMDPSGPMSSSSDQTPLETAIWCGARRTIAFLVPLLGSKASLEGDAAAIALCRALAAATHAGDAATVDAILSVSPAARGETGWCFPSSAAELLQIASGLPDASTLEVLLRCFRRIADAEGQVDWVGLDTIIDRSQAIIHAARWRRHQQVRMLLEAGGSAHPAPVAGATTAAILSGDPTMLRRVLDAGAAPDADDAPTITIALAFRQPEMIRMLVAAGADPNRDNGILGSPLCAAAGLGLPPECRRMLIELGADDRCCPGRGLMNAK